ncbi:hypothetical protein SAMN05518856_10551 [Paenibacillus sp. OK003]|nr:hypothetical protein SAMN05518856_10551 [Paenibacillus sp. OK003]
MYAGVTEFILNRSGDANESYTPYSEGKQAFDILTNSSSAIAEKTCDVLRKTVQMRELAWLQFVRMSPCFKFAQ